ncbi:MAG: hypothetical protein PHH29_16920 [Desulfuromonadaceae bacterium]|nr:hypothetical protein [Desulfuromonadaceae bacterium]
MLLGNGFILNKLPLSQTGGIISNNPMIFRIGDGSFNSKASIPDGYVDKAYILPIKAGSLSARNDSAITISGSGAMGVNGEATVTIEFPVANADAQLIVSGLGSTSFEVTSTGSVVASLSGVGSTTFTISLNHLAMFVDAYGFAIAQLNMLTSGSGTLTGKAICGGSTVDTSGLSPASIWSYSDRTLTGAGGLSTEQQSQLDAIESMTGIIPALL